MTFVTGLIVGLIIGWAIEWLIDLVYWREGDSLLQRQLFEVKEKNKRLETELAELYKTTVRLPPPQSIKREKDILEQTHGK